MLYSPEAMHIPDGFLSIAVSISMWVVTALVVLYALRQVSRDLGERQVPLMGMLAAAIFAGQMLNFSVGGGTSGHLMGAALATILLGPWAAVLVLTTVVGVQALIFQDGGLLVLGANAFNMAVVGVAVAYMAYRTVLKLSGGRKWGVFAGSFISAWLSIEIASLAVALQLAVSGTSPANIAIPAMAAVHALIGVGEGLITLGAVVFVIGARPDLLQVGETRLVMVGGKPFGPPGCCWRWGWRSPPRWPPQTRMGWSGLPGSRALWTLHAARSTRSFPITCCPVFRTRPWQPCWRV
jgi:cobalt/nickel transport system permease protein